MHTHSINTFYLIYCTLIETNEHSCCFHTLLIYSLLGSLTANNNDKCDAGCDARCDCDCDCDVYAIIGDRRVCWQHARKQNFRFRYALDTSTQAHQYIGTLTHARTQFEQLAHIHVQVRKC